MMVTAGYVCPVERMWIGTALADVIAQDVVRTAPISMLAHVMSRTHPSSSWMSVMITTRGHSSDPTNLFLRLDRMFLMLALALASPVMTFLADSGIPKYTMLSHNDVLPFMLGLMEE